MKKIIKKSTAIILTIAMLVSCFAMVASAWNAAPANALDLSLKLVGMMNVKIFQDSPYLANVSTVSSGTLSGTTLYAQKFSTTGTGIGKNWPHQMGDGPYGDAQLQDYFGVDAIKECMQINEQEVAVYMLYDFGDPNDAQVQKNMSILGITDIDEYYALMAKDAKISISAYAGGGTAHETAITAYYRYSDDWRTFAKSHSGSYVPRATLESMGIAAPNENRYFFETQESQKFIDGRDAFPGVFDESVQQYIDHKESYSLPVWEDENEDASWNIINPVPTCNIYSRWGTEFNKDTTYSEIKAIKDNVITEKYGENYTSGQWYGYTDDQVRYYDGVDIDDMIVPKNWEWAEMPYHSTKSGTTYSSTTAYKSHLGYGEYCPAATTTYHDFYLPENLATDDAPSRFMTVMVRETGTMCGLDGCGHWHTVKVSGVSTTNVSRFEPEINDDSAVIDYGLSTTFAIDQDDWVWTTDSTGATEAKPNIANVKITSGDPDNEAGYSETTAYGKYGILTLNDWKNEWGAGNCTVTYTPMKIVDDVDVFYYKVYPNDTDFYEPLYAKITIVPASIVYYEDNFSANDSTDGTYDSSLVYNGTWSTVDSSGNEVSAVAVNGTQQSENENYGYDLYYESDFGYSDGTAHKAQKGDELTFTFKGTGCDVIMRTDAEDGNVRFSATKSAILPDGSKGSTETPVTGTRSVSCRNDNGNTLYQLPVVSLRYDELAYYTVTVKGGTTKPVYVDGIRVYNPLGIYGEMDSENDTIDEYYNALEKNALATPVYDMIYNSKTIGGEVGFIGMYDNWNEWYGTEKNADGESTDFDSHLTIGPNNEIYLAPGQSLVFNVTNATIKNSLFAIEAKGLSAAANMTVSVEGSKVRGENIAVNSNTAMYYIYDLANSGIGETGKIKIQNSGSAVLALTNLKYSKFLAKAGRVFYKFVDESGAPVSGVSVTLRNSKGETVGTVITDANGTFTCDDLPLGTYKAYIVTPKGKSSVRTRTVSVSESSSGDVAEFVLRDIDLEIGSAPEIWHSATVEMSSTGAAFHDYRTFTPAGSYTVTYTFDGANTGYWSDKYYLKGTLTVIVNADGTASYNFVGSGKADRKTVASKSGTFTGASITNDELSIDYNEVLNEIFGTTVVTNAKTMMPTGTSFYIQAYEYEDASIAGEYGEPAEVVIGEASHITSLDKATLNYTITDEATGAPISGVKITVDGQTVTTGADGKATITNVSLGEQTVTFVTPNGKSNIHAEEHNFTPTDRNYSASYKLRDFDLTIGSHETVWHTPSVELTKTTATIKDVRTFTDAGSYKVEYTFDGSTSGRIDGNNFLKGTLTVIVNDDGTAEYSFDGSGKVGGNGIKFKSGTTSTGASIDNNVCGVVIDYATILSLTTGSNKFNDMTHIMPDGTAFSVTAYEYEHTEGENGNTVDVVIGETPEITSEQKATISYTFKDEKNAPVAGVKVMVDGQTAVSGADGKVEITNVSLGEQTVSFETPTGLSNIKDKTLRFDPTNHTASEDFVLSDFDLTIGSGNNAGATVKADSRNVVFSDVKPYTTPGSYKIHYDFDGTSGGSGYVGIYVNIQGGLDIIVNEDGSATFDFDGSGQVSKSGWGVFGSNSGETNAVTVSGNDITVDMVTLLADVTGFTDYFTNAYAVIPQGTEFKITAYESENLTDSCGETATLVVGAEPEIVLDGVATLCFDFIDEDTNLPIEGVIVTAGGISAVSGADGKAVLENVPLKTKEVKFETPNGKSKIATEKLKWTEKDKDKKISKTYILRNSTLEIGSGSTGSPFATVDTDTVRLNNIKTSAEAGSYKVEYTFDGSDSGVIDKNNYLKGTFTLIVNPDGTTDFSFDGTAKIGGKNVSGYSGTSHSISTFDSATGDLILDYVVAFNRCFNTNKLNDASMMIPSGTAFSVTAYESENAGGQSGDTASVNVDGINSDVYGAVEEITLQSDTTANTNAPIPSLTSVINSLVTMFINFLRNLIKF